MQELVELISNYGLAIVLVAYYCVKDWKFTEKIVATMTTIQNAICKNDEDSD